MILTLLPALLLGLVSSVGAEETLRVGARMAPLTVADQHDEDVRIDASTRLVLFARDMDAGDVVEAALAEDGASKLDRAGAVFLSDISGMPGIITRMFALPAMRRRGYRMALDRSGEATAAFPARDGSVTVVRLDDLTVRSISHAGSAAEVEAALRSAAEPPAAEPPTAEPPAAEPPAAAPSSAELPAAVAE